MLKVQTQFVLLPDRDDQKMFIFEKISNNDSEKPKSKKFTRRPMPIFRFMFYLLS